MEDEKDVIEEPEEEAPIENKGDKRIQNAEKSANLYGFINKIYQTIGGTLQWVKI
ncbi:hypothetical protein ACT7C5_29095 [Bacillus pacificus]